MCVNISLCKFKSKLKIKKVCTKTAENSLNNNIRQNIINSTFKKSSCAWELAKEIRRKKVTTQQHYNLYSWWLPVIQLYSILFINTFNAKPVSRFPRFVQHFIQLQQDDLWLWLKGINFLCTSDKWFHF